MGIASLDAALSGLRVAQQQINVVANNVSNVGTPGFTRKILPQSSQVIEGTTSGVLSETIIRNVSINLQRDLWTQISAVGGLDVQKTYLSRVEQFHGPPDKELSVAAELGRLKDTFSALADSPEDPFRLTSVVDQATDTARKINDLSHLISTLRNDAQGEMETVVQRVNDLAVQIADLNKKIKENINVGRTTAAYEDQRDEAIKELSSFIDISFFKRSDGVMVIQTSQGVELASDFSQEIFFDPRPLSPATYYPESVAGLSIGKPNNPVSFDITESDIGGKLGGLLKLRDTTFPKQMAQLDELAHKLALRFEAQGLRLFTDSTGNIPSDAPPDPTTLPFPTPVSYVGFSAEIQVNSDIIEDYTLLQSGTTSSVPSTGSNEVVRRVIEHVFGDVDFQQAIGSIDMRTSLQAAPNNTLQNWLGIVSQNTLEGSVDLTAYNDVADILAAGGTEAFGLGPGETDQFTITFDDPDFGAGPYVITINLSAILAGPGNAAQELVNAITADANWAAAVADFDASVSVGDDGQLVFNSRSNIQIAPAATEPLSDLGFAFLGLAPGTYEAKDPYFDIKIGNNGFTRIVIDPNDNENDLYAKLSTVPGIALEDFTASADGFLRIRPGADYINPEFGGDITIVGGPFTTASAGINAIVGPGTIPDNLNIASSLFGSFSTPPLQNLSPITDVNYGSQTDGSLTPPIPTSSFRSQLLGPNADITIGIVGSSRLIDFAQKLVNENSQELLLVDTRRADEDTLRGVLDSQLLNESGVNIDEEMSHLIVVQTAYAAAARVVTAVDGMFQELLDAIR